MISVVIFGLAVATATVAQEMSPDTATEVALNGGEIPATITTENGVIMTNGTADTVENATRNTVTYPVARNYDIQVSTIPIQYEPRYFTDRTRSDMVEFLDRAARDVDFAESQITLATESARTVVSNDVNEAKNFVIKNHEKEFNEALQKVIDEDYLWECAKKGEKIIELKSRIIANRVNDCLRRASNAAMDVVSSTKSHIAEDRMRRMQKYNEDVKRLTACMRQQERHCIREQINLIDRNVDSLAADAKNEVERVREARRQQISEFGVCRRFQDQCYIELTSESDRIVERCIRNAHFGNGHQI